MSTTTIRLSEELKQQVARVAQRAGVSSHNFILQAIAEKANQDQRRAEFEQLADSRFANLLATGESIPWEDMRRYLQERMDGKEAALPKARKR
jgi:predicted transcriptional regulator